MTAISKVTRLALYALLGLLLPLCVIGFFFPDVLGLVNLAVAAIATMGPVFTVRLIWEHRCLSEGLSLMPLDRRSSLAISVVSATLSILPLILFISSLNGWPNLLIGGLSLLAYSILQWLATTRPGAPIAQHIQLGMVGRWPRPPSNMRLQLTPNSSFQWIRGTVLAAGAVPQRWSVSAVGRS